MAVHIGHESPSAKPTYGSAELVLAASESEGGQAEVDVSVENPGDFFVFAAVLRPSEAMSFAQWEPVEQQHDMDVYCVASTDGKGPRVTVIAIAAGGSGNETLALGTMTFSTARGIQLTSDLPLSFGEVASQAGEVRSVRTQAKSVLETQDRPLVATHLGRNRPNPFNPQTEIEYSLGRDGLAELSIFDVSGRLVRTLFRSVQPSGEYRITWNGRDNLGRAVASGVYVYRLKTADYEESRRLVIIR
jgi:hypothetical protein